MSQTVRNTSRCKGGKTLSTKVDEETKQFIEGRSRDLDVSPSEYLRRLLDLYRMSVEGELACPSCMGLLDFSSEVEHERY